ncbi:DUF7563 family protein [Halogranum amylolyticum]
MLSTTPLVSSGRRTASTSSRTCHACGASITRQFACAFGDIGDRIFGCMQRRSMAELQREDGSVPV